MTYIALTLKLIFLAMALLLLLIVCLRLGESKLKGLSKGKYLKVIEKTALSKNSYLYLLKLGEDGVVIVTNEKGTEVIKNVSKEELEKIELEKKILALEINEKCNSSLEKLRKINLSNIRKVKGDNSEQ